MTEGWDGRGLVSTAWLARRLAEPNLRLFDVTVHLRPSTPGPYRIESGQADYEAGHIPGAAFLDLARDFSDPKSGLGFTMPSLAHMTRALAEAGVEADSRIVAYTTTTPMWATRLWWMLRACGFDNAAVLDGGFPKWSTEGRNSQKQTCRYSPARTPPKLHAIPTAWADKAAVLAAIDDGAVCTLNALSPGVHSGESAMSYGRKGHIKGSRNVPYAALLQDDGTYRADSELRILFSSVGALQRERVIVYCGGGISATMDALALTRLGHPSVAVYDGSMSEWSRDPNLPMELGT